MHGCVDVGMCERRDVVGMYECTGVFKNSTVAIIIANKNKS